MNNIEVTDDFTGCCKIFFEGLIKISDDTFFIMYGQDVNGGFIWLPRKGIFSEASIYPNKVLYNKTMLSFAGVPEELAYDLATGIKIYFEQKGDNDEFDRRFYP